MNNTNESTNSGLVIGIILGILILGGIFLYMRNNGTTTPDTDKASLDVNVKMPTGGDTGGTGTGGGTGGGSGYNQ